MGTPASCRDKQLWLNTAATREPAAPAWVRSVYGGLAVGEPGVLRSVMGCRALFSFERSTRIGRSPWMPVAPLDQNAKDCTKAKCTRGKRSLM